MRPVFSVRTTPQFDRLARRLAQQHPPIFPAQLALAVAALCDDPYNRSGRHAIRKLHGVRPGEGQFRLRVARWRFRYDVADSAVVLHYCGLRRESSYR